MKSLSGMLMDVLHLQFHHGNISSSEVAVEVSLKEATEQAVNTSMILTSLILIT